MNRLAVFARRFVAVTRRDGVGAMVGRVVKYIRLALGVPSAEQREYYRWRNEHSNAFDAELGVDTGGTLHVFNLTVDSPNVAHAGPYIASGQTQFTEAMAMLDIDPAGTTFVDLGAGKGRALLLAANYPFAAITGVEFAVELHATCLENIARFGDPRITCTLGDAEGYAWPDGPLVVFLNNPFDRPLIKRVVAQLTANLRANPRAARAVYTNPAAAQGFTDAGWRTVAEAPGRVVFAFDA